jgi:hypothetical protein
MKESEIRKRRTAYPVDGAQAIIDRDSATHLRPIGLINVSK